MRYSPDHERIVGANNRITRVHLNSARYLKIGKSLWVDRVFSQAVLNAMYHFHASASAYADFWNDTYSEHQTISRCQVWQAFVQESLRMVASSSDTNLTLPDKLTIDEVTTQAFDILGEKGVIRSANDHQCQDCTHPYKSVSDVLTPDDPAAVVGIDENRLVPALVGPEAPLAVRDAALARQQATEHHINVGDDMDVDNAPVRMVVVDGIVMGHQVCDKYL
jgi:hypothetical protein